MKNFTTLLFLAFSFIINAQTKSIQKSLPLVQASPESVGMSSERLARIDKMCEQAIANDDVPGIVALVARKGKIVYHKAFGVADNDSKKEMKTDAIFRIASQTKAITSTAVMMLWEEGRFRLDDPISKYIPEFKNQQIIDTYNEADGSYTTTPVTNEITIRHLLTHTSGIGYGVIDGDERFKAIYKKAGITDLYSTKKVTIGESVKKLAKLPLHHNPGDKFTYSEGLDVMAYFVEVISGTPFDEFLRTHIFDPLGMNDTWFYLPKEKENRLVTVHRKENGKWTKRPVTFYDTDYPIKGAKTFFSGGAGLSSTTKDYATFLQMYLNKGELNGIRIISRTTVQMVMGNQTGDLFSGPEKHYGLAFGVITSEGQDKGGLGSEGTFDWGGYFNTQYFADPKEEIIGLIFKQIDGPSNDQSRHYFRILAEQAVDD